MIDLCLLMMAVYRRQWNLFYNIQAMSAAKQQQQQLHRHDSQQLQRMSSISQYIERRPSDPNCLQQAGSPTFESPLDKGIISGRRSLPEMQGGSLIGPSAATTTISIGGNGMLPRKSALKQVFKSSAFTPAFTPGVNTFYC
jgi:hypothetical protein